jgi:hypothetical protein
MITTIDSLRLEKARLAFEVSNEPDDQLRKAIVERLRKINASIKSHESQISKYMTNG